MKREIDFEKICVYREERASERSIPARRRIRRAENKRERRNKKLFDDDGKKV